MTSIQHNDPDESIKPLPEDNDPPFSPPTDPINDEQEETFGRQTQAETANPQHQITDSESDNDVHEQYDEGITTTEEPNAGNDVVNYDPDQDQRKQSNDQ